MLGQNCQFGKLGPAKEDHIGLVAWLDKRSTRESAIFDVRGRRGLHHQKYALRRCRKGSPQPPDINSAAFDVRGRSHVGAYVRHSVDVGASKFHHTLALSSAFLFFPLAFVLKQEISRIYRCPSSFFLVSNQELSFFRPSFDRQFLPYAYVHICCAFYIKSLLNSPKRVPHLYLYTWYTLLGVWKFLYHFQN
jgi:hypothetical protein